MPIESKSDLPGTIERSPAKAQRTFRKAYNSALETYDGDEERARRTAYSALKHEFEKVGDHWEPKDGSGPSDERAARGAGQQGGETAGGVDVRGHTKEELYERAKELNIQGRSKMDKQELAQKVAQQPTDGSLQRLLTAGRVGWAIIGVTGAVVVVGFVWGDCRWWSSRSRWRCSPPRCSCHWRTG
jgi:cation transport regulator ChaB